MAVASSESPWQLDEPGLLPAIPVGDQPDDHAWSARFRRADMPGSMVTVRVYVIPKDGRYGIQVKIEYLTCTDPDDSRGTETWASCIAIAIAETWPGPGEAEKHAEHLARYYARQAAGPIPWDGHAYAAVREGEYPNMTGEG